MTDKSKFQKRTLKSFFVFFLMIFLFMGLWSWTTRGFKEDSEAPFFRSVLEWNGRIWHALFDPAKSAGTPPAPPRGKKPRFNGDLGLKTPLNLARWSLLVEENHEDPKSRRLNLSLEDIRALPRTSTTVEFKCIEGWSDVISYSGVKFSDFLKHYRLGAHSEKAWDQSSLPTDRFAYVALETPDGEYYVSIDMESMLHPQTLLVYEMNGEPISDANGAPLRLLIPVKYGIKSLKRIGKIYFSDHRPPDYWAERGYDWFSGL